MPRDTPKRASAARLHTTTIRVDADLWADVSREAARLGVGVSTYMRDAARERVVRTEFTRRIERLECRTERLAMQLQRMTERVQRLEAAGRRLLRMLAGASREWQDGHGDLRLVSPGPCRWVRTMKSCTGQHDSGGCASVCARARALQSHDGPDLGPRNVVAMAAFPDMGGPTSRAEGRASVPGSGWYTAVVAPPGMR